MPSIMQKGVVLNLIYVGAVSKGNESGAVRARNNALSPKVIGQSYVAKGNKRWRLAKN